MKIARLIPLMSLIVLTSCSNYSINQKISANDYINYINSYDSNFYNAPIGTIKITMQGTRPYNKCGCSHYYITGVAEGNFAHNFNSFNAINYRYDIKSWTLGNQYGNTSSTVPTRIKKQHVIAECSNKVIKETFTRSFDDSEKPYNVETEKYINSTFLAFGTYEGTSFGLSKDELENNSDIYLANKNGTKTYEIISKTCNAKTRITGGENPLIEYYYLGDDTRNQASFTLEYIPNSRYTDEDVSLEPTEGYAEVHRLYTSMKYILPDD